MQGNTAKLDQAAVTKAQAQKPCDTAAKAYDRKNKRYSAEYFSNFEKLLNSLK